MEYVHCMICFDRPNVNLISLSNVDKGHSKFYISSCGHMFCFNCLESRGKKKCYKCGKENARFLEIGGSLPSEVLDLFIPMEENLSTLVKEHNRIFEFQTNQRSNLVKSMGRRNEQLQNFVKMEIKKKEAYKQQIIKLEEFKKKAISYMKDMKQREAQTKISEAYTKGHDNTILASNFKTPALIKHNSFVTSTPLPNMETLNSSEISLPSTLFRQNSRDSANNLFVNDLDRNFMSMGLPTDHLDRKRSTEKMGIDFGKRPRK